MSLTYYTGISQVLRPDSIRCSDLFNGSLNAKFLSGIKAGICQVLRPDSIRCSDRLKSGLLAGFSQELRPESVRKNGLFRSFILTPKSPVSWPN